MTGHWHHGLGIYLPQALFFFFKVFNFKGMGGLQRLTPAQEVSCYFMVCCAVPQRDLSKSVSPEPEKSKHHE